MLSSQLQKEKPGTKLGNAPRDIIMCLQNISLCNIWPSSYQNDLLRHTTDPRTLVNHLTHTSLFDGFNIIAPDRSKLFMSNNGILVRFKRAELIKNGLHEVLRLLRESSSTLQAIIFFNCFWSQAKPVN